MSNVLTDMSDKVAYGYMVGKSIEISGCSYPVVVTQVGEGWMEVQNLGDYQSSKTDQISMRQKLKPYYQRGR